MKQIITLGTILILFIPELVAQSDFRNGYIIKNNNDTIYGLIDYRGNNASTRKCVFKADITSDEQIFTPDEIKAYRFIDGKYYVSRPVHSGNETNQMFLEYLINGIVKVYYYYEDVAEHYLIEDENDNLYELKKEEKEIFINEFSPFYQQGNENRWGRYIVESKSYIGILKYIFRKSPTICKKVENISIGHNSLIRLAHDYHNEVCSGKECIIYEKKLRKIKSTFGPVIGLNGISICEVADLSEQYYYLRNSHFGVEVYPSIGLYFKTNWPFENERFYIQYEGTYSRLKLKTSNTYTVQVYQVTYNNDITLTQNIFDNLALIKYEYPRGKIKPTFQIGVFARYFFKTDYNRSWTENYFWGGSYSYQTNINPFSKFDLGPDLGFGFKSLFFNKKEIFLDFKYQRGLKLLYGLNSNIYSVNLGFQIGK